jgi:thiamine biosynthesis protein ThiS
VCDEPLILITVNGEPARVRAPDLSALLAHLDLREASVAAEVNGRVVPREAFARCPLRDGDVVELVRFVGGG